MDACMHEREALVAVRRNLTMRVRSMRTLEKKRVLGLTLQPANATTQQHLQQREVREAVVREALGLLERQGYLTGGPLGWSSSDPLQVIVGTELVHEAARCLAGAQQLLPLARAVLRDAVWESCRTRMRHLCGAAQEQLVGGAASSEPSLTWRLYELARQFHLIPFVGDLGVLAFYVREG